MRLLELRAQVLRVGGRRLRRAHLGAKQLGALRPPVEHRDAPTPHARRERRRAQRLARCCQDVTQRLGVGRRHCRRPTTAVDVPLRPEVQVRDGCAHGRLCLGSREGRVWLCIGGVGGGRRTVVDGSGGGTGHSPQAVRCQADAAARRGVSLATPWLPAGVVRCHRRRHRCARQRHANPSGGA